MSSDKKHTWIIAFLREAEVSGIPVIYLRNYQQLPAHVGNDIDLLVAPNVLISVETRLIAAADFHGWTHLRTVQFGPLSLFFCNFSTYEFLHVDLFDSLDIHWLPIADVQGIMQRRQWNGLVFTPDPLDEVFINVTTRLFYLGQVRDKHREQTARIIDMFGLGPLMAVAESHIGQPLASQLTFRMAAGEWQTLEGEAAMLKRMLLRHVLRFRFNETVRALRRYIVRAVRRLISPPGPFLVIEGADGIGKSTLIDGLTPFVRDMVGHDDVLSFHWKPTRCSIRRPDDITGKPASPRGKRVRTMPVSLLFATYHWLGFWKGYFHYVLPARARNRAVLSDRYADEFFLDPARLRLKLPDWLLRLAVATVPRPSMVIYMIANPVRVNRRKGELTEGEISNYQNRLKVLNAKDSTSRLLYADDNPEKVLARAKALLLEYFRV